MIELKDLTKNQAYKKQVKKLYKSAFPANERPPFCMLWRKAKKGKGELYAATDGDNFIGLAHVVSNDKLVYMYFLAIDDSFRGMGCGTAVLESIKDVYSGKNIVLNIEELDENAANYSERIRRKAFYERCGFTLTGIKTKEAGVRYDLLLYGTSVTYGEHADLLRDFTGKLIFKLLFKQG